MDAIILAGGQGLRLRPLTLKTPKPLVPVANEPFLATLLARLAQAGVQRVTLSACFEAKALRQSLAGFKRFGMALRVIDERQPLGTGGAIRFAWRDPQAPTLALNGDALSDWDFRLLLAEHRRQKAQATLWVRPVEDVSRFGVVEHDRQGRVRRFVEKPKPGQAQGRDINAGAYVLEPSVRALIPAGRSVSIERETFPACLAQGLKVAACGCPASTYWRDIGNPVEYLAANLDALDQALPGLMRGRAAAWQKPGRGKALLAPGCCIAKGAQVLRAALAKGCSVAAGACVKDSVLGQGCKVGEGAVVEGAVLGRGVRVGDFAVLKPGVVLGDGAQVPAYSRL
jgi:NDP-sugar pyrophosphorylase family protein